MYMMYSCSTKQSLLSMAHACSGNIHRDQGPSPQRYIVTFHLNDEHVGHMYKQIKM